MAHCNQHLDGREGLSIPVSTPPASYATFTPSTPIAFSTGLGCTTGVPAVGSAPSAVECSGTKPSGAGSSAGPFLYNLSATGSGSSTALSLRWKSASVSGSQPLTCTLGSPWAMDQYVEYGAPLFSDYGYTYVSDDVSMAKYTPAGSGGTGTCAWGVQNPASAAMISWNAVYLPPNGGPGGYPGGFYLVGQGIAGPVLLVDYYDAQPIVQLALPDGSGGDYETVNTIAAVETATGARLYDSTADCPASGCTDGLAQVPGQLYAIDITSPTTAGGTPTMAVAWSYSFEGPSGASPVVLQPTSGTAVGDQIYFDGSGPACASPCSQPEDPTLFMLTDHGNSASKTFAADLTTLTPSSAGTCPNPNPPPANKYYGIQAAPVLEAPESSGSDRNDSVWVHASCDPTLYRLDAQTGAQWSGSGASSFDIGSLPGLSGYVTSSTMQTVTNSTSGHTVAFVGANLSGGSKAAYVLALDLETGTLLWKEEGPTTVGNALDAPFHGQFPIAKTAAGGYVLIAPTAGAVDGSTILGIPLS